MKREIQKREIKKEKKLNKKKNETNEKIQKDLLFKKKSFF